MKRPVLLIVEDGQHSEENANTPPGKTITRLILCRGDGLRAIEIIGERAVDLMLIDLNLPVMDGFETMTEGKEARQRARVYSH